MGCKQGEVKKAETRSSQGRGGTLFNHTWGLTEPDNTAENDDDGDSGKATIAG
jgi:hypothetical protein